jgi:microcin C transport system substrate-binding protein
MLKTRLVFAISLLTLFWANYLFAAPNGALGYTPKYIAGFKHFDYVNPQAPVGGTLTLSAMGNFDSLNPYLLKGVAATGISGLMFETLMENSLDEPYSVYGVLAEDMQLAKDKMSVTFKINPKARFNDGSPVEALDVQHSLRTLKSKGAHPFYAFYYQDLKDVVVVDRLTARFVFVRRNPELHLMAAGIPIFSRHWGEGKAFKETGQIKPLTSGPYIIEDIQWGRTITFKRNPDYWGWGINTRKGMYNFERVKFKFYQDETVQLEALKAGEFDFMYVLHSKQWARDYVGRPFDEGLLIKEELPHSNNAGMQGFAFNTRRELFKDVRVRRALSLAFDFEWSNRQLFYNQYKRCDSYFSNTEMAAHGLPQGKELALLDQFRDQLPDEVFTREWKPAVHGDYKQRRENLRQAKRLLNDAGWHYRDGALRNEQGKPFSFEFLLAQKGFERILAPYAHNLEVLGITMSYRTVDYALYERRLETKDFDMVVTSYAQSQAPTTYLRNYWHSAVANQEGSRNVMGIQDPVVDALIEKVIQAKNREEMIIAARALDRVLLHGEYLVPNWYIATHRVAYRKDLAYPKTLPKYYADPTDWIMAVGWFRREDE